ncbi:hypothetical protein [Hydrogenophaga sp.]|uniref:hypothetical protein n=1 Tax=Hydrogenophaga sp. TaxID=1904254 RepID=UPI002FC93CEA
MSVKTVSRTFSGMQRKGSLRVDKRRVILQDAGGFSRRFGALPRTRRSGAPGLYAITRTTA